MKNQYLPIVFLTLRGIVIPGPGPLVYSQNIVLPTCFSLYQRLFCIFMYSHRNIYIKRKRDLRCYLSFESQVLRLICLELF